LDFFDTEFPAVVKIAIIYIWWFSTITNLLLVSFFQLTNSHFWDRQCIM